jgi:beta-lactamase class D
MLIPHLHKAAPVTCKHNKQTMKRMKSRNLIFSIAILSFIYGCSSNKQADEKSNVLVKNDMIIRGDFKSYFDSCGVEGSIAIYGIESQKWIVSDTVGLEIEMLPASTFKIINLLIALETNTIKDENEIVKWVGSTDTVKYGYRPEIYHDMPVKEAFKLSAGWVFVELAKKMGKDTYKKYLTESKYGNNNFSQTEADFWNFGDFAISPKNQVEFLKSLYEEKLPFSKRNTDILKNIMITEQKEDYTIRAKTGWTRENNINTGWWIGYIETKRGTYIFATRLLQDRKMNRSDFGSCRKDITKKVFKDLNII